jgi:cytochrome oxidase Cu insertion factor (SCO1/SenC/PrrC family)
MSNNSSTPGRWSRRAMMASTLPAAFLSTATRGDAGQAMNTNRSDLNRVVAGHAAPDFTLPDAQGMSHKLSSSRGAPSVLVFYRGYW